MMSKKRPQLRFEGFTDDWEERKFDECFKFPVSTNSLSRALLNYDEGDIKSVHYGDILIKYPAILNVKNDKIPYITDGKLEKYKSSLLENGDLIFADAAEDETVGKAVEVNGLTEEHLVSGLHTIVARAKDKKAEFFLGYYINSNIYHRQLLKLMQGSKVSSISKGNLQKTIVSFPKDFEEQQRIGSFFKQLDDTIALHQRKLDLLKEQKKGFLQKMFPKNGETVPEIRFEGFTDAWEERKLEELGNLNRGKSKHRPRNDSRLFGGEYPFIQTGDVAKAPLFLAEYSQTYSEFGIQQSKLWDIGTLLITIAANIADTTILGIKAAFPDSVIGFESTSCDVVFIKNYIDIQSDLLKRKAETSSQANLNLAKLKELNLNVPKLKEQQKIGSFFKQLDDTIALHQRKLDLLKEQKKGFLQKMFV